jgi:hypothetical protein
VSADQPHRIERGLAADPARRGGVEVAGDINVRHLHAGGECHIKHVVGVDIVRARALAVPHGEHVVAAPDDALGEQKSLRQFDVGARCAHGDGERGSVEADLQRLFDNEGLGPRDGVLGGQMLHATPCGHPPHAGSNLTTMAFETGVLDLAAT